MQIDLVGSIPQPIGGISSFCERFIYHALNNKNNIIELRNLYDPYFSNKKNMSPINHIKTPFKSKFLSFSWLVLKLQRKKSNAIFFNFSSFTSLILTILIPKKQRFFLLMLHNGDLNSKLPIFIKKNILQKFDLIFSINDNQDLFYKRISEKIIVRKLDSYFPPIEVSNQEPIDVKVMFPNFKYYCLSSGYPKEIYNFKEVISLAKINKDICFVLVLYGDATKLVLQEILDAAKILDNLKIIDPLDASDFNLFLKSFDIYFRPNYVDSYGLVCADAILMGIKVLASDVCKRFEGVETFSLNKDNINKKFLEILSNKSHNQSTPSSIVDKKLTIFQEHIQGIYK